MTEPEQPPPTTASLARKHARIGLLALLVFLSLGVVLEALHGFKIRFYLDVDNEARRLTLRLAHAHGTLLGVIHLLFGVLLSSAIAPSFTAARRASACLSAALVLLPGGFLLGAVFTRGGDPGPAVLLVPVGAMLLFLGLFFTWRGLPR